MFKTTSILYRRSKRCDLYRFLYRKYLKSLKSSVFLSNNDPRRVILVSDPNIANAFIIDHDWLRISHMNCEVTIHRHLVPIINNVVDNYPYYNRSQGKDHFFMAVYDTGPFCNMQCVTKHNKETHTNILSRISNSSFIGK